MTKIKMYEIIPGRLYQRGEFRKFPMEVKEAELGTKNITMIANLYIHRDEQLYQREPYFYWHYPIPDNKLTPRQKEDLLEYSSVFVNGIRDGQVALVHCHAGRNRSALFSTLIVMRLLEMNAEQAIEYVRTKRPNSLANPNFVEWLMEMK